jgi:hypothetical protein
MQVKWLTNSMGKKISKESETLTDDKGNILKSIEYNKIGSLCQLFDYEYKNGLKIKKTSKACNGNRYSTTLYIFDKSGRVIQENDYDDKQKLQSKKVNTYIGSNKNLTSSENYGGNEKRPYSTSTFEYFLNGLLKKETQTAGGSWYKTNNYKYDSNKNLIYEDGEVDGGVGLVRYYYTYNNNILIKDVVKMPDTGTEYHIYETK